MKIILKLLLGSILILSISNNLLERNTLVVGILTLDVSKKLDLPKTNYMFTSYAKWLEQHNIEWIPISLYDTPVKLYEKLNKVNGVFLTGGSQNLVDKKGFATNYKRILESIVNYAKTKNNGGTVFPILGTCLGFESLLNILTDNKLAMKRASNENEARKVTITSEGFKSDLNLIFSEEELKKFSEQPFFYYHHTWGYLKEDTDESSIFNTNINALGYNIDDDGKEILAIFEHKEYPFIGWQFHPEKAQFEHNETFIIDKTEESLEINSRFSKLFWKFLKSEKGKINFNDIMEYRKFMYIKFLYSDNDESFFFPYVEENKVIEE